MNNDFSKPQRQSAFGIIVMGAHTTLKLAKAFSFIIIIAFVKTPSAYVWYILLALGVAILIIFIFAYLWFLNFTFFLDENKQEFIVNKGIFNRDQLTIPFDKIQQVNINQSILQKIIGVYGLKIDTAGSHGEEVSIKAIDRVSAYNLKEHLLNKTAISAETTDITEEQIEINETPFLRISASTLLKVGLTSNYGRSLALIGAFFYTLIYEGRQILDALQIDKNEIKSTVTGMATIITVAILVIAILFLFLLFNIARTFYKFYELEISKHQNALLISSGLIAKKTTLVNPNKVQLTKYSQNYFQHKLNMLHINLKQAHFGQSKKGHEMQGNTIEIPGCNFKEKNELLKMILGQQPTNGKTFIPNWRFLNLPIFFKLVLPLCIFGVLAFNIPEIKPFIGIAVAYFIIGSLMIYVSFKKHKIAVNQDFIIKTSGIWDISKEIISPNKIQAITTFQYPWHKSVDVGHLCLHTAAGKINFKYGNYTEIKLLVNYWLFQVESGNEDWM